MNFDQIRYLAAISRHHSLRHACEHLHVTAQALSQSISTLEKELNLSLTESSRNGTFLTPNGYVLLEAGEKFLHVISELQSQSASSNAYKYLPEANISILTVDGMANTLLPKILSQLYLDYPKIQIKLNHQLSCSQILTTLADTTEYELAFISIFHYKDGILPNLKQYPTLTFQPLVSSKYCCSVPKNHEIYHYNSLSLSTALKYPVMIYKTGEELLLPLLNSYAIPKKIICIPDFATFNQLLQTAPNLTFNRLLSSYDSTLPVNNRKLILLKENITISFGYVYRNNHTFSPMIKEFLDVVSTFCINHYGAL